MPANGRRDLIRRLKVKLGREGKVREGKGNLVLRQRVQWIDPFALFLLTFFTFYVLYAFRITSGVLVGLIVCDMNFFARDDGFLLNLVCYVHSGIYIKSLHFRIVVFWLITDCTLVDDYQHFAGTCCLWSPPVLP